MIKLDVRKRKQVAVASQEHIARDFLAETKSGDFLVYFDVSRHRLRQSESCTQESTDRSPPPSPLPETGPETSANLIQIA